MNLIRTIKTNAKNALTGRWGTAILIWIISMAPAFVLNIVEESLRQVMDVPEYATYGTETLTAQQMFNYSPASMLITVLFMVLSFLIIMPLMLGGIRWYYRRSGGAFEDLSELFHYFETARDYFKAVGLQFWINLRMILWSLLIFLPMIILVGVIAVMRFQTPDAPNFAFLTGAYFLFLIWSVLSCILLTFITLRYFLANYLLCECPAEKVRVLIKRSIQYMHGHKGEIFLLGLSFIVWYLPSIGAVLLLFGALLQMSYSAIFLLLLACVLLLAQFGLCFYLVPYQNMSFAIYARYLIHLNKSDETQAGGHETREYIYKTEVDQFLAGQAQPPAGKEVPLAEQEFPLPPENTQYVMPPADQMPGGGLYTPPEEETSPGPPQG